MNSRTWLPALLLLAATAPGQATHRVTNGSELVAAVANLGPGDVVTLAPGTYPVSTLVLRQLAGAPDRWIVLRSESGTNRARIVGTGLSGAVIDIDSCGHLRFEDLEITSSATAHRVEGVRFPQLSESQRIVFDRCWIHGVTGNGVLSAASFVGHLQLLDCEISACDDNGISLGFADPYDRRIAAHTVIRGCYIHHTSLQPPSPWSYGIHIKPWSYASLIEDNVIHDVATTSGAVIALYGPSITGRQPREKWNIVRRNVLWDSNGNHVHWPYEGIFATNSAIIENNVVYAMRNGISVETWNSGWMTGEGPVVDNLTIRHNTVYNCRDMGIGVRHAWAMTPACEIVNNASLMLRASAYSYRFVPAMPAHVTFGDNGFYGQTQGVTTGLIPLADPSVEFVQNSSIPPVDLYPSATGSLRNATARAVSAEDFNGTPRTAGATVDLGAYEWTQPTNPGWAPVAGFRQAIVPLRPGFQQTSASQGGQAAFSLHGQAGAPYALLISTIGPDSDGPLPVVPGPWTSVALSSTQVFAGYLGVVPSSGMAQMQMSLPPLQLGRGMTLYHGAVVWYGQPVSTNLVRVVLLP